MDLQRIQSELDAHTRDEALYEETNLVGRAKALDLIALVDEIVRVRGGREDLTALKQQAASLKRRLDDVNAGLFGRLRAEVRSGDYTRSDLRRLFDRFTAYSPGKTVQRHIGTDGLDLVLAGILGLDRHVEATREPEPEMVHYEPTPARATLDLVDNAGLSPDDVFYDLGSGLGQVAILVSLLTRIKTKGIEVEPAFCAAARKYAQGLGLFDIEFINVDARDADLSDGTIFFMFTPFKGTLLQAVLGRLRQQAHARTIKVCTYGSCTITVAAQPWLTSIDSKASDEFKLAIFKSTPATSSS